MSGGRPSKKCRILFILYGSKIYVHRGEITFKGKYQSQGLKINFDTLYCKKFKPMFKRTPLLLALLFVSFYSLSQSIDLAWGPEKKFDRRNDELGFVGKVKGHFYTLRREDKKMYLAKNRVTDMGLVFEKQIRWNDGRKNTSDNNLTFNSFRLFRDNFVFYFEDYSRKDDIQRLYAQKISFDGEPIGSLVEVGSRVKLKRSKDGSFTLSYSPDSTNFVVTINPSFDKYNNERFIFKVFSQDLDNIHNAEVVLPFQDKNFEVESVSLGRNKLIYVLAKITLTKKERANAKDDDAPYYFDILTVNPKDGKVKEFEIDLDKRYVDEVDLLIDKKDNIKCFGFYGDMDVNGRRKDGINGIFYFSVANGKIDNVSTKEFDAELVKEIAGKRRANRSKGLRARFNLKNFFEKQDGGAMVLAEESYLIVVTTRSANGGTTTKYHYYRNSVIAINIDRSGKILWYTHIPKKQHVVNDDRFISFYAMYVKGKTYIIYNDERRNAVDKSYDKVMTNYFKSEPVVVTVSEDGKATKRLLSDNTRVNAIIKPNAADKISDNQAFFYADRVSKGCCFIGVGRPKTQRFGILTIK
jgi:hypothetical protein